MKSTEEKDSSGTRQDPAGELFRPQHGLFFEADSTLEHYLEVLTRMELPEGEEADKLWTIFQEDQREFRRHLGKMGLPLLRLQHLLEKCSSPDECEEIFPHSFLQQQKKSALSYVENLKKEVSTLYCNMEKAFGKNGGRGDKRELAKLRKEGEELFASLPLLIEYVFRLYEELKLLGTVKNEEDPTLAEKLFRDGCNCAQAVACAFADECGLDEKTLFKIILFYLIFES